MSLYLCKNSSNFNAISLLDLEKLYVIYKIYILHVIYKN